MNDSWIRPPLPTKSLLLAWSQTLRFFRYYRHSGHSDINDEFVIALRNDIDQHELLGDLHTICRGHLQSLNVCALGDRTLIGITDSVRLMVTEGSIKAAVEVERVVELVAHALLEPPLDSRDCYSPITHPEIWGAHA